MIDLTVRVPSGRVALFSILFLASQPKPTEPGEPGFDDNDREWAERFLRAKLRDELHRGAQKLAEQDRQEVPSDIVQ